MSEYDLSILIPGRNEMWFGKTVENLLENTSDRTEIICVIDGGGSVEDIPQHERVTVVYLQKSIGQRAATNLACKLSKAKYIAKADAHTLYAQGFDTTLIEDMEDDAVVVPVMKNLHAFDWVCDNGHRRYQGPSGPCLECNAPTTMDVQWKPRNKTPNSKSYCYDSEPHFNYFNDYTKRDDFKKGLLLGYLAIVISDSPDSLGIVDTLTDFANSHNFSSGVNLFRLGEKMSPNAVSFSPIDNSRGIRPSEVLLIGDQLQMPGVTASSVLTKMIDNGDVLPPTPGKGPNKQGVGDSMGYGCFVDLRTSTVSALTNRAFPVPTPSIGVDTKAVHKLDKVLRGDFIYDEHITFFHNANIYIKPVYDNSITETMSLQGSFFMCTRKKYWELDISSDKDFGSWGSQGLEVANKFWLTGGRVLCNHRTWYAHLFRTQGGDFSFPYPQDHSKTLKNRAKAREMFFEAKWKKQVYPLSFLLEKFWPITSGRGWSEADYIAQKQSELKIKKPGIVTIENRKTGKYYTLGCPNIKETCLAVEQFLKEGRHPNRELQEDWDTDSKYFWWHVERFCRQDQVEHYENQYISKIESGTFKKHPQITYSAPKTKGILYYTDGELDERIAKPVRDNLRKVGLPITAVSLKPIDFGDKSIHLSLERGPLAMAKQILSGLEVMDCDIVFFCEHDVLYPPSAFDFVPPNKDVFFYNVNVWRINLEKGYGLKVDDCRQLSGLCAYRETLIDHYKEKVRRIEAEGYSNKMGHEPGTHNRKERIDNRKSEAWKSSDPIADLRHKQNYTRSRWRKEEYRNKKYTEGWEKSKIIPFWGPVDALKTQLS